MLLHYLLFAIYITGYTFGYDGRFQRDPYWCEYSVTTKYECIQQYTRHMCPLKCRNLMSIGTAQGNHGLWDQWQPAPLSHGFGPPKGNPDGHWQKPLQKTAPILHGFGPPKGNPDGHWQKPAQKPAPTSHGFGPPKGNPDGHWQKPAPISHGEFVNSVLQHPAMKPHFGSPQRLKQVQIIVPPTESPIVNTVNYATTTEPYQESLIDQLPYQQLPTDQLNQEEDEPTPIKKNETSALDCGFVKSNDQVKEEADMHEYPWHVAFYLKWGFACEGVLISDLFVLTTSSCVKSFSKTKKKDLIITIGDHDLSTESETDNQKVHARTIIKHAKYEKDFPLNNDVALVELEEPVTFSKSISPICLPNRMDNYHHTSGTIPSWGRKHNIIQESEVKLMNSDECKAVLSRDWIYRVLQPGQLCSIPKNETGSCTSTRGAGVVIKENRHWVIIGLVSSSRGCADITQPQINVRLQDYVDWIKTNANVYTMCRNGATTVCETVNE